MYQFNRRRDTFTVQEQEIHLLEPDDLEYQAYQAEYLRGDSVPAEKVAAARVRMIAICICDESGKYLIAQNKLTESEIHRWPIGVTKEIERRCMKLVNVAPPQPNEGEGEDKGESLGE